MKKILLILLLFTFVVQSADVWAAVCSPVYEIQNHDRTGVFKAYKNIIREVFYSDFYSSFSDLKTANEANPNTLIAELTETQYNALDEPINLWHDGNSGLPKWQYNTVLNEFGNFSDPNDTTTTWTQNSVIADSRLRLTIRHEANLSVPSGSSDFPTLIKLAQFDKTTGGLDNTVTLRFEVRNTSGNLLGSGANGRHEFTNGGTPSIIDLVNGIGTMYLLTDKPHKVMYFRSNHAYRVDNSDREIRFQVSSKVINSF